MNIKKTIIAIIFLSSYALQAIDKKRLETIKKETKNLSIQNEIAKGIKYFITISKAAAGGAATIHGIQSAETFFKNNDKRTTSQAAYSILTFITGVALSYWSGKDIYNEITGPKIKITHIRE